MSDAALTMAESLDCFVCSELDSIPCPDANSDYASWKAEAHQYVSHDPAASNDGVSCSIIIGGETLDKQNEEIKSIISSLWADLSPVRPVHHPVCEPQVSPGHGTEHRQAVQRPGQQSPGEMIL